MFKRNVFLNKANILKLIGLSAATAITLGFIYTSSSTLEAKQAQSQLVSVILLTRHGARTPISIISTIEQVCIHIYSKKLCQQAYK